MRDTPIVHADQGNAIEFAPFGIVQRDQLKSMLGIGEQAHIGDQQIREIDLAGLHVGQHVLGGIDQRLFGAARQPFLAFKIVTSLAGDGAQPSDAAGMLVGKLASEIDQTERHATPLIAEHVVARVPCEITDEPKQCPLDTRESEVIAGLGAGSKLLGKSGK